MAHEKVTQEKKYFVQIVKGSFHQGNTSIFSANSVGKQCVPNCAIAALYTSIVPLYKWTSDILDNILKCGDKLYNDINSGHDFLQVHEIGKQITMYNNLYVVRCDRTKNAHGSIVSFVLAIKMVPLHHCYVYQ